MRLFTALWPPVDAVDALRAALPPAPEGWRATDPDSWHVTLAFHGEADPGVRARELDAAARGAPAPRLRASGSGAFPGVVWAGVRAEPLAALHALVAAAGGDPSAFTPHVTVLRRRGHRGAPPAWSPPAWSPPDGPWWTPTEVLLVHSGLARGGPRYRVVHRVPLTPP